MNALASIPAWAADLAAFLLHHWAALLAPIGGLSFRARGGLFGDWIRARLWAGYGNVGGRAQFALLTTAYAWWLDPSAMTRPLILPCAAPELAALILERGLVLPVWPAFALAIFLGLCLGWFHAADIGRDRDRPRWVEMALMTLRGLVMTIGAGGMLWVGSEGLLFAGAGLALGLLYEAGHRTPSTIPDFQRGMEMGELYAGTWLWLALWLQLGMGG